MNNDLIIRLGDSEASSETLEQLLEPISLRPPNSVSIVDLSNWSEINEQLALALCRARERWCIQRHNLIAIVATEAKQRRLQYFADLRGFPIFRDLDLAQRCKARYSPLLQADGLTPFP